MSAAEGDTVSIGGTQAEADRRYEKAWHNEVQEGLKTNFEDAKEQEYIEKDKEKPLALARRALRNIEGIPDDCPELKDSELDGVLSDIIAKINQLRKHTKKIRKHLVESRKSRKTTG